MHVYTYTSSRRTHHNAEEAPPACTHTHTRRVTQTNGHPREWKKKNKSIAGGETESVTKGPQRAVSRKSAVEYGRLDRKGVKQRRRSRVQSFWARARLTGPARTAAAIAHGRETGREGCGLPVSASSAEEDWEPRKRINEGAAEYNGRTTNGENKWMRALQSAPPSVWIIFAPISLAFDTRG